MPTERGNKTIETIRLAMEILKRIPHNRYTSAPELQRQLEAAGHKRNVRNIQKQLKFLVEGFDIECNTDSKPYSYRWKKRSNGFSLSSLSDHDALILSLAEQHLKNLLPAKVMTSMEGFFNQANKRFDQYADLGKDTEAQRSREWLKKARVVAETQPLVAPKVDPQVIDQVSNALYFNRWLEIVYKNADDKRKQYDVMPLGLAQQGPRLYLVCRFKDYDNERILAMHRILSATSTPFSFDQPKDFDLEKYDDEGKFGYGSGRQIQLSFCIDKDAGKHLLESALSVDQEVETFEDHYRISASVKDTVHLRLWLNSFGEQVWDLAISKT